MMTIRDSNYITILAPMITQLKLKGNELLIFSIIHGFSQDGESRFKGSVRYLTEWTGLDRGTVIRILRSLTDKGYIDKYEVNNNNVRVCEYSSNYWSILDAIASGDLQQPGVVAKCNGGGGKMQPGVVAKCNPDIYIYNNNDIDNDNKYPANEFSGTLFPDKDISLNKKSTSIFRNSEVYKLVKDDDYSEFEKLFKGIEFQKIDLPYYFNAVADWSDTKIGVKRTAKGWIATVRNFIRGDMEKGKVHLKLNYQPHNKGIDIDGAMEYLKDY